MIALSPLAAVNGALGHWPHFSGEAWLALAFLGTVGAVVQFSVFNWALRCTFSRAAP